MGVSCFLCYSYTVGHYGRNYSLISNVVRPIFMLRLNHGTEQPFYGSGTGTERELFYGAYCIYFPEVHVFSIFFLRYMFFYFFLRYVFLFFLRYMFFYFF